MASKGVNRDRIKALQAKSAALSKRYKHEASQLKKAGVLTLRIDARKNISRSTRTKINKFRDVIAGENIAIRAVPSFHDGKKISKADVLQKYEGILETRGPFLIIPKERSKERGKISRGLVEIERELVGPPSFDTKGHEVEGLHFGTEREVILPFKITDMQMLVDRLREDETLDGLKRPDEMFAFKLDGWASKLGFPDARTMGDYIIERYQHLFKAGVTTKAVKYLSFVRYKAAGSARADQGRHKGWKFYGEGAGKKKLDKRDKERARNRDALRNATRRANETPAARAQRLAKQKTRSAQNRQRKFEGD